MREKHGNPVVIDIIDQHLPFKNQWRKRKTFYKKQNYKIIYQNKINEVEKEEHILFGRCMLK